MTEPRKYEYNGMMLTRKEICIRTGISQSTMSNRLGSGMTVAEAVAKGINVRKITRSPKKPIKSANGKIFIETGKTYRTGAQHVPDKFEMDSAGKWRLKWKFLSGYDLEMQKVRETCRKCRYAAFSGKTFCGCSYFDDVGRCRRCDPRDCIELGFFEPKKRGPKPKRIPRIVL